MSNRIFGLALSAMLLAVSFPVDAQQPAGKVPQIGFLTTGSRATEAPRIEAFRQGLRELGYVEGKNINIEYRYADGKLERLPELAEELVRLKVDILVASNATVAQAAKKSSATIPIVMAVSGAPLGDARIAGSGLVASLARPGGNVTGLTNYSAELLGKRVELLKDVVPKVSRFAFLNDAGSGPRISSSMVQDAQIAAQALGVKLQLVEVRSQDPDIDGAFRVMLKERIGALITSPSPLITVTLHQKRILELSGTDPYASHTP